MLIPRVQNNWLVHHYRYRKRYRKRRSNCTGFQWNILLGWPVWICWFNDELVIFASDENNGLMIWALPDGRSQQDRTVDQPLHS